MPDARLFAAGLRVSDVISHVDGERVKQGAELQQILLKKEVGDTVKLGLIRGEEKLDIEVELVKREDIYRSK